MAQVVVYGRRESLNQRRAALSEAIHAAIMAALEYPPEKKFQRFIAMDEDDFIYPADRGVDYTIIEISMFEGRTDVAKRALIAELFARVEAQAGISPHSVEITITETPRANWGIRGNNAADLALNYRVEVLWPLGQQDLPAHYRSGLPRRAGSSPLMGPAAWIQDVSEEAGQALDDDGTPERRARSLARLSMLMGALALSRATEGDPISDEFIAAARTALTGDRGQATI